MNDTSDPTEPDRRQRGARLRAIAIRAVAWCGVAVLLLLALRETRCRFAPRSAPRPAADVPEPPPPADPGWPHLRGPHYNATSDETGLADSWPDEGPPVLWTRDLGRGYSGFTVLGDRAYTQTQTLAGQSVVCLEADTGRTVWQHGYGYPFEPGGLYPGPRATPTWHAGRVYFAGPYGLVGCLRASDGKPLWSLNVKEKFAGRGTDFGYSSSPLVEQGKVILPVGGQRASVVALDARDGSTVWASGDEPSSYCSAIPITLRGRRHVVTFLQNALASFDLETGRLLWQEKFSQGYDEHAAMPLYEEPYLMIASPFRSGSETYRLEAGDSDSPGDGPGQVTATTEWFSPQMSNDVASSVLVGGFVYGFDLRDIQSKLRRPSRGQFKCMELTTGAVRWSTDRTGHAAVIAADGKLLLFNDTGEVLLLRASPDRYEELARAEVFGGEICWTAPSLSRGRLYLRSPSQAACVYVGRPEDLDRRRFGDVRPASEIPKSKPVDLAWLVRGEREYPFDLPDLHELSLWYAFSAAGVLGVSALIAMLVYVAGWMRWPEGARRSGRVVFWVAAFGLGIAGTGIFNRHWHEFVFTWPVALFVAHQVALLAIFRQARRADGVKSQWVSLVAGLFFVAVCLGYFVVCRQLGLAVEWVFLIGFLPSWPIAIPAAIRLARARHPAADVLWALLSFSAYYWATAGYVLWRAWRAG